ncbi:hypothetical protein DENSPDRAFT_481868 [Dentipellis sp. KUC8613]|nr:hypothetical protein DENSPDRAFT_481868 [Dentipellis sp. KUC8613]
MTDSIPVSVDISSDGVQDQSKLAINEDPIFGDWGPSIYNGGLGIGCEVHWTPLPPRNERRRRSVKPCLSKFTTSFHEDYDLKSFVVRLLQAIRPNHFDLLDSCALYHHPDNAGGRSAKPTSISFRYWIADASVKNAALESQADYERMMELLTVNSRPWVVVHMEECFTKNGEPSKGNEQRSPVPRYLRYPPRRCRSWSISPMVSQMSSCSSSDSQSQTSLTRSRSPESDDVVPVRTKRRKSQRHALNERHSEARGSSSSLQSDTTLVDVNSEDGHSVKLVDTPQKVAPDSEPEASEQWVRMRKRLGNKCAKLPQRLAQSLLQEQARWA